jgi:hypothetical protein
MTKQTAIKKIEKLNFKTNELVKNSEVIWKQIKKNQQIITDLKREYNIGCTLLDESLMDYYKSESRVWFLTGV